MLAKPRYGVILRTAVLAVMCALLVAGSVVQAQGDPRFGGVLRVAVPGDPPMLDIQYTTAYLTEVIAWHVFEPLFTYDENYQIVPMLADRYEVSADGKRYTIHLRQGVSFHDGSELTADDVVASLNRWLDLSQVGGSYIKPILESMVAADRYTVEIQLSETSGLLLSALAQPVQMAAIYPKRVVDQWPDQPVEEFVGTGPFRFVEWRPNQYVRLERFDGYAARDEDADGYGGRRVAYVDEIRFIPVPEVSTRMSGVQTGTYDIATDITTDLYDLVAAQPNLVPVVVQPYGWPVAIFNKKAGIMADVRIRRAFLAALDMDEIMAGTFGNPLFYRVDPSLMFQEQPWWSDAGSEYYNQKNPELAKQLLAEAGYNGEPVRWVTSLQYDWAFRPALIATEQLQKAGFNIELQVVDWATVFARRSNPDLYDVFSTSFIFSPGVSPPTQPVLLNANYPGWWEDEHKEALVNQLVSETDPQRQLEIWSQIQHMFWEDAVAIKFGDFFNFSIARPQVKNFKNTADMFLWNVWLE